MKTILTKCSAFNTKIYIHFNEASDFIGKYKQENVTLHRATGQRPTEAHTPCSSP